MSGIFQTGRICTIIGLIWVVSIVAILPAMFYTGTYDIYFPYSDLPLYHLCMEQWPHPWVHTVYSFILMMVSNAMVSLKAYTFAINRVAVPCCTG